MSDPVKEWFSVNELAEWLQMSPHTVYQWRYRGTGPVGHRIGRHLRFRREDVEAWLEQRRDKPTAAHHARLAAATYARVCASRSSS